MNYTSKEVYEFISQKNNDPIVEWKICKASGTEFPIYESDLKFYDKISPTINGVKYQIPTPTLCPEERQRRRLAWRNERKLYKRKCDATGETIISMYSPDKAYKVYDQKVWWSDNWNPMDYARNFDFSRSFFEQFGEFLKMVPLPSLLNSQNTNSDYANYSSYLQNSYLIFDTTQSQNCLYGNTGEFLTDCVDYLDSRNCENSFELVDSNASYGIYYGRGCNASHSSSYVVDLDNSHHCFLSHTLYNKSYYFEDQHYSPQEYEKLVDDFNNLSLDKKQEKISAWQRRYREQKVYPFHMSVSFEKSFGMSLLNVKNSYMTYGTSNSQNIKYSTGLMDSIDSSDIDNIGVASELSYEVGAAMRIYGVLFGVAVWGRDLLYCHYCTNCANCFACIGLQNKEYCIMNKQYTKEEYRVLVSQIIEYMQKTEEWGEFFPIELSQFGYNETLAQQYFPLSQPYANAKNYKWQTDNYDPQIPEGVEVISKSNLPQDIQSVTDDILKKLFICEVTGRPFRIIKQELEFYKKHNLPLPTKHPDQRHLERIELRNPRHLWKRSCMCENCASNNNSNNPVEFVTTFSPDRPEKVYCEVCYNKEVYG